MKQHSQTHPDPANPTPLKPYRPPVLTVYGRIADLTNGYSGKKADGLSGRSRPKAAGAVTFED
ncbi:MAG: lasso RiPP family leader peptide-containing protein [Verrucomicrobia bacterium]|nr:lasso RiPP family leader peptide-containing protein [Verrucomicrobiota bacterium]